MIYAMEGQVGKKAAADFRAYITVIARMPDIDGIIADPKNAPLPTDPAIRHAVCSALARRMTDKNAASITTYAGRIEQPEFVAFMMKDATARDPNLKNNNSVREWIITKGRELIL